MPSPTPVPFGFRCGPLDAKSCRAVADAVFSSIFLEAGQRFGSAQVKPTAVKVCPTGGEGARPKYDVVVLASDPVGEFTVTIVEFPDGRFGACTY